MKRYAIFRISTKEILCEFSAEDLIEAYRLTNKWYGKDALDVDVTEINSDFYRRLTDEGR